MSDKVDKMSSRDKVKPRTQSLARNFTVGTGSIDEKVLRLACTPATVHPEAIGGVTLLCARIRVRRVAEGEPLSRDVLP